MPLARLRLERVPPDAARVVREQVDRHRGHGRRRAHPVDVVARRDQGVEVSGHELALLDELEAAVLLARTPPRPACRGRGRRAPRRDGRARASASRPGRRARRATASRRPPGRGATGRSRRPCRCPARGAWYSAGSQSSSASRSAKRGRIASHASSGEPAPRSLRERRRGSRARPACRGRARRDSRRVVCRVAIIPVRTDRLRRFLWPSKTTSWPALPSGEVDEKIVTIIPADAGWRAIYGGREAARTAA